MSTQISKARLEKEHIFFSNEEPRCLDLWWEKDVKGWEHQFRRVFNGEYKSFQSMTTLRRDAERLIKKFNLVEVDEECFFG